MKPSTNTTAKVSLGACIAVFLFHWFSGGESEVELAIRNDLDISDAWSIRLVKTETFAAYPKSLIREEAVFLKRGGKKYVLTLAYRYPYSRQRERRRWVVGESDFLNGDGLDGWVRHERKFDYFPTDEEIQAFLYEYAHRTRGID
ncbi:MAG: hypothetical protein AAF802_29045 [Planctomycetota bacterium]